MIRLMKQEKIGFMTNKHNSLERTKQCGRDLQIKKLAHVMSLLHEGH